MNKTNYKGGWKSWLAVCRRAADEIGMLQAVIAR